MKSKNLLFSLNKREIFGVLRLKKPIKSYSLSSLVEVDRLLDTFLGISIASDFIISLSFDSIENDNFYTNSYKNVSLVFNTSPIYGGKISIFHKIHLGLFQNFGLHFHFFQNVTNVDLFVVSISEIESDFLIIVFGNLPSLLCVDCQNKSCKRHGIIARFSYQYPSSDSFYRNKLHQVTAIYPQGNTLVVVLADCEGNVRFVTATFPETIVETHSYPSSYFPFSIRKEGLKIIENECDCFYGYSLQNSHDKDPLCTMSSMFSESSTLSTKCQRCLIDLCVEDDVGFCHKQVQPCTVQISHDIRIRDGVHKRALLPLRPSVYTCQPCCKKTFLTDIHASYQSLLLYKYDDTLNNPLTTEYDPIHGEVLGANTVDDSGSYHWRSDPPSSWQPVVITEELVFNTATWTKARLSENMVHCLGIASGKLELTDKLLVHLMDEEAGMSYLVELDINSGSVKSILQGRTSSHFCDFVTKARHLHNPMVLDLNNDLQVTKGKSVDVITDHDGVIQFIH